ncbi:MAG: S-layer homology domain-containing protein [Clostridia bacterium]|nr:S-layer homology domain-containing protein [Clostridia bacterium]
MKRVITLILSLCLIMSMCVCVNAVTFSDLADNHWAYKNIMSLVNEGTINGYEDGTFKPSKTVTRAEFAKMIGKWDQKYNGTYSDISESHWAYDYIMWSGLDAIGSMIYPDMEIKRGDVINLIWKRNGSPKHNDAPSAITKQGTNPDAASWAYTIGLMKGDDGLNLRLDGSLTRAEAATLIIRSREMVAANATNNFIDIVDEELLKKTYNTLNLLGEDYKADRVLTNAELARMAIVFAADGGAINMVGNDLVNKQNEPVKHFEHKYAKEMYILCKMVWGEEFYTIKNADSQATMQDAIGAIMYGFIRRGTAPSDFGKQNDYYPDCKNLSSAVYEDMSLTYAKTHGIKLYANGRLGAEEPVTVKKYAALLLQFNEVIGLGTTYTNGTMGNAKMNTYLPSYPANNGDFYRLISGVPVGVYNLKSNTVVAKEYYNSFNKMASVYITYTNEVVDYIEKNTGYNVKFVFYPSASYKENGKAVFTVKFTVQNNADNTNISVDKLFGDMIKNPIEKTVKLGQEFYVVFETYESFMDMYLPRTSAYVKAVFTN